MHAAADVVVWAVDPLVGIGPFRIGMPRIAVRDILATLPGWLGEVAGAPESAQFRCGLTLEFEFRHGIDGGVCTSIEAWRPHRESLHRLVLDGVDVFVASEEEVRSLPSVGTGEFALGAFVVADLSLGLTFEFGHAQSLLVGEAGYFDFVTVAAPSPPPP